MTSILLKPVYSDQNSLFYVLYEMVIQVWPHEETQERHTHMKSYAERVHCIPCRVTCEGLGEEAERSKEKAEAIGFIGVSKERKARWVNSVGLEV